MSVCLWLTDQPQLDPGVPCGRLPEVNPAPEDAPVLDSQVLDVEEGLDDGRSRLGPHPGLEELEEGAIANGAVVAPVPAALALTNVETAKGRKKKKEDVK